MVSRSESRLIRALGRRRGREREGLFLAEGIRVVEELLDRRIALRLAVISSTLEDTERGRALRQRLQESGGVREVGAGELGELADTSTTQGVLVVAEIPVAALDSLIPSATATVLVIDGVQDPGNLGTLARSAAAFGCEALVALPGTVDPWNPKAVRSSAGALFRLPVVQPSVEEFMRWLRSHGFGIVGADAGGAPVTELDRGNRTALVLGNEGAGLSEEATARCDGLVAVPMPGGTNSLNVAVAGAILMYELTRGRA